MATESPLWRQVKVFLPWFTSWYNRMEVDGLEHLPPEGEAAVVCPNHPGLLDPVYVHIAIFKGVDRWLRWLGWADLMTSSNPVFQWIVKQVGTVTPVEEHHGKAASKEGARRALDSLAVELQAGHLVGLFPEGTNHHMQDAHKPYKFHTGALRLAAQQGVPIIPVAINGTQRVWPSFGEVKRGKFQMWLAIPFWFPAKVKVRFGPPFHVNPEVASPDAPHSLAREEAERLKETIYALRRTIA